MLDCLLTNATVVDGTGAPARHGDVAIRDGRVVATGTTDEPARHRVDVDGLVVAPGVVDIHTHYDAQLLWDPTAGPSPLHGVTTVIGGNCGFTLAPAGIEHADYLTRMMARVEGIPLDALEAGLTWDWRSVGEYLAHFDGRIAPNAGFLVGHSAIRRSVMGDRAVGHVATDAQVDAMVAVLHEALAAGGLGFSTSNGPAHHDGDGNPVPSRAASPEEVLALAGALRDHDGTTVELIIDGCVHGFTPAEIELMTAVSLTANRPVNWNLLSAMPAADPSPDHQLHASTVARERGRVWVALALPHSPQVWITFLNGFAIEALPGWRETLALPPRERAQALGDPAVRRRLSEGAARAEGMLAGLARWERLLVSETFAPVNDGMAGRTVGDIAAERGDDPFEVLCDIVVADELRTGLMPGGGATGAEDWDARAQLWRDPRVVVGGSDAGAHVAMMCGAVYSTFLLGEPVRTHGCIALEEAVRLLTDVPARLYGLRHRGRVAAGWHADLVVFDPERVAPRPLSTRADLPGGATRLYAEADGIHHVFVNGVEICRDGAWTGSTPGTLLRSGTDTDTVPVPGGAVASRAT